MSEIIPVRHRPGEGTSGADGSPSARGGVCALRGRPTRQNRTLRSHLGLVLTALCSPAQSWPLHYALESSKADAGTPERLALRGTPVPWGIGSAEKPLHPEADGAAQPEQGSRPR